MKTSALLLGICLYSISTFAANPIIEQQEQASNQKSEFQSLIQNVLHEKTNRIVAGVPEKCKIIILDSSFKTIREETVEKMEDICNQSTLVPIIYRSEFITRIHNISYFMLQKNK